MSVALEVAGASTLTGNVAAAGDLAVAGASTLTGNVIAEGSVDITGAAGLILENDETITNSTDGTVLITSPITKMSVALEVAGASTLTGNVAAAGDLAVAGASTLTGNVAAAGDLAVAGASTLTGNVIAAG